MMDLAIFLNEESLLSFCERRYKERPRFCESFAHIAEATIERIYSRTKEGCWREVFLLYRDNPSGKYSFWEDVKYLRRATYEQVETHSAVKR